MYIRDGLLKVAVTKGKHNRLAGRKFFGAEKFTCFRY